MKLKRKLLLLKTNGGGIDLTPSFENINLKVNTIFYEKMV